MAIWFIILNMKNNILIELNDKKIEQVLKIPDVLKEIEKAFIKKGKGLVSLPPKSGPKLNKKNAFCDSMSSAVFNNKKELGIFGVKWISVFLENSLVGLPNINGIIIINEPKYGLPKAILSANYITGIRTAAVSGVCAKHFCKKKNPIIGIFGLGLQAKLHIKVFQHIYKNPKFILYEHSELSKSKFLSKLKIKNSYFVQNFHEVVKQSDIILSATTFPEKISPYIFKKDLKKEVLILPIDYGSRISDDVYNAVDNIFTDDIEQFSFKRNNTPYFSNKCPNAHTEVGDVLRKKSYLGDRILVFNLGIGLFDIVLGDFFVKQTQINLQK